MKHPDDLRTLILDVTGHDIGSSNIRGEKGSSKTGGSGGATSAPDTLFSTATVRIVDLLSEGDIAGLANGLQSIFFNDVPVVNPDGSSNFKGLQVDIRTGFPDQTYMAGFPDVETTQNIGTKVANQGPVSASITEPAANRARVTIQFPSLFLAKNDGSVSNNNVSYRINVKSNGGPWVNAVGDQTLSGKTTSGYFRSHEFALPEGSSPWTVQVVRISPDTDGFNASQQKYTNQSDIVYYSLTTLIDSKFSYPNSAVFGITAQASSFGSSVPVRKYMIDGIAMAVPSNYDTKTRAYSGIWDGTFKRSYYCNNPAWVMYALMTDARFGLGDYVSDGAIDKFSLYNIGRYCDELVPDGMGGQEPRAVFNGVIETQQEAYELLQLIAQIFRGMVFWSSGAITAAQDRPRDVSMLVTEANVQDGLFTYSSSSFKARHTVAVVKFQDPNNLYKTDYEVVQDDAGVARYGYNPTRIDLLGCTSRGQARRAGKWVLLTELQQTQGLTYKAGLDHAPRRPGDIVAIQDPSIVALDDSGNLSGRLRTGTTTSTAVLDHPVILDGSQYYIEAIMPDGSVQSSPVQQGAGTYTTLSLSQPFTTTPDPDAVWIVYGKIQPRLFSITGIHEEEPQIYAVSALEYQPSKYAAVDIDAKFQPTNFTALGDIVPPPTNLSVREATYTELGKPKQALTLSWTPGNPFNTLGYYVTAIRPSGAVINLPRTVSVSVDFADVDVGQWTFLVTTVGLNGNPSVAASLVYTVKGWAGSDPTLVQNLQVLGGGASFTGQGCTMTWTNAIPASVSPYPVVNVVQVLDISTNAMLHYEVLPAGVVQWTYDYQVNRNEGGPRRSFRVSVCARYATGSDGPYTSLAVSNPPPAKITPTCIATSEVVFINFNDAKDNDWRGYLCWISTTKGFNPLTTTPTTDTSSDFLTFKMASNTTYYVRAAAYDSFGKTPQELNISDEVAVTTTINQFDPTAPNIPATPALTTAIEIAPDGTATAVVKATWAQDTSAIYGVYDVQWAQHDAGTAEADKGYVGDGATSSKWEHHGFTPGKSVSVKVRAASANGFAKSGFSPVATIVAALNTTPPNPVTGLTATASFQNAFLSWVGSASRDLDHTEVWSADGNVAGSSPPSGAKLIGNVAAYATTFIDSTLSVTGTRTYWVRPVNTSGTVASSYAGPAVATSAAIQGAQLAGGVVDATKLATSITAPTVVSSVPASYVTQLVYNTTDSKLYRWTGSLYTAAVAAADLLGQITTTQIRDDAITTPKILAGSVTAISINANDIFGNNGVFNSLSAGIASFGGLKAGQIAAGAITTDKIGVGLSTGNLIWGSDLVGVPAAAITSFNNIPNVTGFYAGLNASGSMWQPTNMGSIQVSCTGSPGSSTQNYVMDANIFVPLQAGGYDPWLPCQANARYEFSTFLSCHRCTGTAFIAFANDDASQYQEFGGPNSPYDNEASGSLSNWFRSVGFQTAPSWATRVRVWSRAYLSGGNSPYMFTTGYYLAVAQVNQSQASPWAVQSRTVINGGQVVANSLNAIAIVAGSITTDRFTSNSIDAGIITTTSFRSSVVNTGLLTADNISVGNGNISSVFGGSNSTKINGGAIQANTIDASRLYIGQRGIVFTNVEFYQERDGNGNITGRLNWTDGQVNWKDANNNPQAVGISAGSVARGSDGWQTVWWNIDYPTVLQSNAGQNVAAIQNDPRNVLCATSADATGLAVYFGGSRIDGTKITALSIVAGSIAAGQIQTQHMGANTIQGDRIAAASLVADKLTSGTISAAQINVGTDRFQLQGGNQMLRVFNNYNGAEHITLGYLGPFTGDGYDFGLIIRDASNGEIARFTRSGNRMTGAIIDYATIGRAQIASLAVDNLRIAGQAVSQCAAAGTNGNVATVAINLRGSGNVLVQAFRRGGGGNQYQQGVDGGALQVLVSTDNQNFSLIDAVTNNFSFLWDPNAKGSYKFLGATSITVIDAARGGGVFYYRAQDTNGAGVGGVVIQVTELSK